MEIGIPSPCCHPPAICPSHAENDSNRQLTTLFIYDRTQNYFSTLALVSNLYRSFNTSTKPLWACAFLFSHMIYTFPAHHILRDLIWPDFLRRKNPTFLAIQFYTAPSHFLSLRSKHSPQQAGSITPVNMKYQAAKVYMKSSQYYIFLPGFHPYVFRYKTGTDRVMNLPQQLYIVFLNSNNRSTF